MKRLLSLFLCFVLCLSLLPTAALAETLPELETLEPSADGSVPVAPEPTELVPSLQTVSDAMPASSGAPSKLEFYGTGPCDVQNIWTFDIGAELPSGTKVTNIELRSSNDLTQNMTETYSPQVDNYASITIRTLIREEPYTGDIHFTIVTDKYGSIPGVIHGTLTGKYIVHFSARAQNAMADGQPHAGYTGLTMTLTSGESYTGDYTITYATQDGTDLGSTPPTDAGDYTVTFSIPEDNEHYRGSSQSYPFSILPAGSAEARYQTEAGGQWYEDTFAAATAGVYDGGTVEVLRDFELSTLCILTRDMTITSADAAHPATITRGSSADRQMLAMAANVTMENLIIDGGSQLGRTADCAAVAVGTGEILGSLTMNQGAVIQNNNNVREISYYRWATGGGVYVYESCTLTMNHGSKITDCKVSGYGGGVFLYGGILNLNGGEISNNSCAFATTSAYTVGGAVYMDRGETNRATFSFSSGKICGNYADLGGGIYTIYGDCTITGGSFTGNSAMNGGAMYINPVATVNFSGGTITDNKATYYGAGCCCAPGATIKLSGDPVISGNTSSEETDGGLYLNADTLQTQTQSEIALTELRESRATQYENKYKTLTMGTLNDGAEVHICTYPAKLGFIVAYPAEGGEITRSDVAKLSYNGGDFALSLHEDGYVVLSNKTAATFTAPTAVDGLIYNSSAQTLCTALQTEDGTPMYRVVKESETEEDILWSETLPAATDPGSYTVSYYVKGDGNHLDSAVGSLTVQIAKAPLTITAADKSVYIYGTAPDLSNPILGRDYTISGFQGTDDRLESTVTVQLAYETGLDLNQFGQYAILLTVEGEDSRYELLTVNGTLDVQLPPASKPITSTKPTEPETPETSEPSTPDFIDVPDDSYFKEPVDWAVDNGITEGVSTQFFAPDGICTRAQAVTFLWRMSGCPAPERREMPFEDVTAGSYYYEAVLWAAEQGVTVGTSATTFSPDENCSRAHIVTFLWRACGQPAAKAENPFVDVSSKAYYVDAVLWAVEQGITLGTTAATFSPDDDCTRAQIVTFIYRAMTK